jgi:hypothetical protein
MPIALKKLFFQIISQTFHYSKNNSTKPIEFNVNMLLWIFMTFPLENYTDSKQNEILDVYEGW